MLTKPGYWLGFFGTMLLLSILWGCDVPTEYTVSTPDCPWPPPLVTDTTVHALPLGCPYRLPSGTTVDGWPL